MVLCKGGLSVRQTALMQRLSQLFSQRVALGNQPVQFLVLVSQAIGGTFLAALTRRRGSLFDQLTDIVPDDGDAVVKFSSG